LNDLLKRWSVFEFCDAYQAAVADVERAIASLTDAKTRMLRLVDRFEILPDRISSYEIGSEHLLDQAKKIMLKSAWQELIRTSGVRSVMIDKRQRELDAALQSGELPPIEHAAVQAWLNNLRGDMPRIIAESIEEANRVLRPRDRAFATNGDGWKVGRKAIVDYVVSHEFGSTGLRHHGAAKADAIDNAFHLLDGKGPATYPTSLSSVMKAAIHVKEWKCETAYFRAKWFKAGTLHLEFKRLDLVDRLNGKAADHRSLRDEADAKRRGRRSAPQVTETPANADRGFFPTPAALARQLVRAAGVAELAPGARVLDPSAGEGSIAHAIRHANHKVHLTAVEIDPARAKKLESLDAGGADAVYVLDFLTYQPLAPFDAIIANPPFGQGQDVAHVRRMFELLSPGGRLVSVMSAGVTFRQGRADTEFRTWVESAGGVVDPLPDDSFKESGTSVRTVVVVMDKPIAAGRAA